MLIRFFKTTQPAAYLALPLLGLIFWFFIWLQPFSEPENIRMPLYLAFDFIFEDARFVSLTVAFLLILFQAFYLERIINSNDLKAKNCHLTSLFYLLFMSSLPDFTLLQPVLFANLFLLFVLHIMFLSYRKDEAFSNVFNAGFLVSIAALFYFPSIVFGLLIFISLLVLRPFIWREWVITAIGMILPFVFAFFFFFMADKLDYFIYDILLKNLTFSAFQFQLDPEWLFYACVTIAYLVFAIIYHIKLMNEGQIKAQKFRVLLLWYFGISLISFLLSPGWSLSHLSLLGVPVAVFYSNLFLGIRKNWIAEVAFLALLGTFLYGHIRPLF